MADKNTAKTWKDRIKESPRSLNPELIVVGGGSAVGKTTFIKRLTSRTEPTGPASDFIKINTKRILREYPKLAQGDPGWERHPEKSPKNRKKYYKVMTKMTMDCLKNGISVVLDDHCDDYGEIKRLMAKVNKKMPRVETALLGLFVDYQFHDFLMKEIIRKASEQGIKAEDAITKEDSAFMHESALKFGQLYPELTKLFDTSILYQNVDRAVERIATHDHGNYIEEISNAERYQAFCEERTIPAAAPAQDGDHPRAVAEGIPAEGGTDPAAPETFTGRLAKRLTSEKIR